MVVRKPREERTSETDKFKVTFLKLDSVAAVRISSGKSFQSFMCNVGIWREVMRNGGTTQ